MAARGELMRKFIERQWQAREYNTLLRAKVDAARAQRFRPVRQ